MYYVFDGAEMHYFADLAEARAFYVSGSAADNEFRSLWELGFEDVETGFGCVLDSQFDYSGCVDNGKNVQDVQG